jgi:hypothetical protein
VIARPAILEADLPAITQTLRRLLARGGVVEGGDQ